jgi:hypothetical protein
MNYAKSFVEQWVRRLLRAGDDNDERRAGSEYQPKHLLLWACSVSLILTAILFLARVPFIDDSYITFRYSQRLSDLGSLSWNNGVQPVMGTTTVLWTILLSGLHTLGLTIEGAALGLTTLLVFLLLSSLLILGERIFHDQGVANRRLITTALIAIVALHVPVRVSLFSGMETTLYCLLVVRCLVSLSSAPVLTGLYAGLAALTRPDGVLLLLIGLIYSRDKRLPVLLSFLATTLPWGIYSFLTFGQILPDSIAAKQILYPSSRLANFLMLFEAHSQNVLHGAIFYVAGAGLCASWFMRSVQPFTLWLVMYAGGIVASGIKPIFFWYFAPTWLFGMFSGGVAGTRFLVLRRNLAPHIIGAILVVIASIVGVHSLRQDLTPQSSFLRESVYREVVSTFKDKITPGDTILVGETGIIGFGFPENTVIDSASLVSLEVRPLLHAARAEAAPELRATELAIVPGWSKKLIEHFSPTWIIAARARFDLINLEADPWFTSRYDRTALFIQHHLGGIAVYRRR